MRRASRVPGEYQMRQVARNPLARNCRTVDQTRPETAMATVAADCIRAYDMRALPEIIDRIVDNTSATDGVWHLHLDRFARGQAACSRRFRNADYFSFDSRGGAMSTPRILLSAFIACAVFLSTAYSNSGTSATLSAAQGAAKVGESHHRRGAAEPGTEGDPQLGSASRGPEVGHVGRCRHRSDRRTRLGLRALRRGHGWRGRGRRRHMRHQPRRSRSSSSTATPVRCWRTSARA